MGVVRRPRTVLAAFAVAAILACFLLSNFRIDGDLASLMPSDDPTRRCPDISLAKQELDWQPRTSLADGLKRTIEYFDSLL